jgi:hypothetical protein
MTEKLIQVLLIEDNPTEKNCLWIQICLYIIVLQFLLLACMEWCITYAATTILIFHLYILVMHS